MAKVLEVDEAVSEVEKVVLVAEKVEEFLVVEDQKDPEFSVDQHLEVVETHFPVLEAVLIDRLFETLNFDEKPSWRFFF